MLAFVWSLWTSCALRRTDTISDRPPQAIVGILGIVPTTEVKSFVRSDFPPKFWDEICGVCKAGSQCSL